MNQNEDPDPGELTYDPLSDKKLHKSNLKEIKQVPLWHSKSWSSHVSSIGYKTKYVEHITWLFLLIYNSKCFAIWEWR